MYANFLQVICRCIEYTLHGYYITLHTNVEGELVKNGHLDLTVYRHKV